MTDGQTVWGKKSTKKDTKRGEIHPQAEEQTDCEKEIKPKQDWGLRKVLVDQLERRPIALRTAKGRNSNWAKHFDQKRRKFKVKKMLTKFQKS